MIQKFEAKLVKKLKNIKQFCERISSIDKISPLNNKEEQVPELKLNSTELKNSGLNSQYVPSSVHGSLTPSTLNSSTPKSFKQIPITHLNEDFSSVARKLSSSQVVFV